MIKRMMPWMIMMLTSITLITLAALLLWHFIMEDRLASTNSHIPAAQARMDTLSAKEKQELTVQIENYMTNLANMNYLVRLSFSFVLDNKSAKEEMEMLVPSVKSILNRTLADTDPEEITGSEGLDHLSNQLKESINDLLTEGNLREIEITERLITTQH